MTTATTRLLLACIALALCCAAGLDTFPSGDRSVIVASVLAAHSETLAITGPSSASASSSASSSSSEELALRLRGSSSASRSSSTSGSRLPTEATVETDGSTASTVASGENGFGHVTYDGDRDGTVAASAFGGMRAGESQAQYHARIRKMQRVAERKNPDLRLKNLVAF